MCFKCYLKHNKQQKKNHTLYQMSLGGSLDQCHWAAVGVHPWEQSLRRWEIMESEGVERAFGPRPLLYPRARSHVLE